MLLPLLIFPALSFHATGYKVSYVLENLFQELLLYWLSNGQEIKYLATTRQGVVIYFCQFRHLLEEMLYFLVSYFYFWYSTLTRKSGVDFQTATISSKSHLLAPAFSFTHINYDFLAQYPLENSSGTHITPSGERTYLFDVTNHNALNTLMANTLWSGCERSVYTAHTQIRLIRV